MEDTTQTMADGTVLDPKVLKVTRAIRQVESGGNYNAVGDNGNSHGAYQFNKNHYQEWAPQYGVDPNDFSPAAQNKVAYSRIKDLKDQGKSPDEIAAIWNGGHTNTATGTIEYNAPEYGVKFRNALLGGQQTTQQQPQEQPTQPIEGNENDPYPDNPTLNAVTKTLQTIFPGEQIGKWLGNKLYGTYGDQQPTKTQLAADIGAAIISVLPLGTEGGGLATRLAGVTGASAGESALRTVAGGETDINKIGQSALVGGGVGLATGGLIESGGAAIKGLKGMFSQKTEQEIAAMASNPNITEKELANLSPTERTRYNDIQNEKINQQQTNAKTTRDSIIEQEKTNVAAENNSLKEQLDTVKHGQAGDLKEPALESLKKNSQLFEEYVDKGFAEGKNMDTKVSSYKLEQEIEDKLKDPEDIALAKKQFGLDKLTTTNPENGNVTYKDTTLGDIWKNSKELRTTLTAGSKAGSKTFSPEEMKTIENTKILTDLLQKEGMDLTEANDFWSQWTKLRKRIIGEVRPFDVAGSQKAPIESTIERAATPTAKGYNDAKQFISSLEREAGLETGSITKETEDILSKIEKNKLDKANIQKLGARLKQAIADSKDSSLKDLDLQKFNTQQIVDKKNKINRIVRHILIGAGLLSTSSYGVVKHIL